MTVMTTTFHELLDLTFGSKDPSPTRGARQRQLILSALLLSLGFAAIYGLAAGSRSLPLALANLYKLPMIVLISTVCAVPAGTLAWKLSGTSASLSDVFVRHAGAVLAGTAVLCVLAPLLAVYYQTSSWAGPLMAMGVSSLAVCVALIQGVRKTIESRSEGESRAAALVPLAVLAFVQLATMLQLVALASPIVPEVTGFEGGLDGFFGGH